MQTVATFLNEQEAHLLRIRLEGFGIFAVVHDANFAAVMPALTNAIGGIRVQVSYEDIEKAREALQEEIPPETTSDSLNGEAPEES